jgi:hypothetical protein
MSTREKFLSEVDEMPESAFEAYLAVWTAIRQNSEPDHFWSEENQSHLSKVISDFENGITKPVYKTMEELEAYE